MGERVFAKFCAYSRWLEGIWEYLIKDFILREIRNICEFDKNNIIFRSIGKHDQAHKKALGTYRKGLKPDKIVQAKDITSFIK